MCQYFRPEDPTFGAVGDGETDDSQAFANCIEEMDDGDVMLLSCLTYRLNSSLVITKPMSILGEFVSPHFAAYRCVLLFPPNITGIKVLHGLTIRDVQVQALRSIPDPQDPTQRINRDWRTNAHGIWTRRALRAGNVRVEGFATDGVFLDTRTKSFIPASVAINNNAPTQPADPPQTATATLAANTPNTPGNEAVVPFFVVSLHGFQTVTPSNGTYVRSATATDIEFELTGTPGANPLASFSGLSAERDARTRVGRITGLPRGHGLIAGCLITTSNFSDNVTAARVLSDFDQVVNNVTVYGITYEHASGTASGSLGTNGSLNVTQGLLRTIENSSHWELDTCSLINNGRHGLHTDGPDSNAGLAVKVDARSNGEEAGDGSGFYEESFLGNTYLACHTNGNRRSYDKPAGSASNRSRFISCYAERNQAAPLITAPAYALSGQGSWTGDGQAFGFDASYGRPTTFVNRDLAPGRAANLPLNRVDFNIGGPRGAIFSFEAHANELPGPLIEHVCSAVSITNNTATATVTGNTARNQVRVDTPVTLHGYINNGSSNGMLVSAESPTSIEFPLAGSNGPIPGLTVPLSNVSAQGGIATATVPRNHGLLENMRITTSGLSSNDTGALITDVRPTMISYATAGSPTGNGTAVVTQGLLRTVVASSLPYRWHFILDPDPLYQHWFALQYLSASIPPLSGRPTPLAFSGVRTADASGARTNVAQIWFPNGFYYGGGQAKQNAEDRGPYRATTYRETGLAPATRAVAWGMGPPSGRNAGTWAQGDIVWNANAAIGQPAGWMCIEGSNQQNPAGSWAAMASLV